MLTVVEREWPSTLSCLLWDLSLDNSFDVQKAKEFITATILFFRQAESEREIVMTLP